MDTMFLNGLEIGDSDDGMTDIVCLGVGFVGQVIRPEHAALIVTACNAHDDLLAALQGVLRVADRATDEFDAARAAIAKATGVTP